MTHGLVWEDGSIDLGTTPGIECEGKAMRNCLPEGDGESLLRRYIDDSINLLTETEWNRERVDRELPPVNLLWPSGPGFRPVVPNLAIQRRDPAIIDADSLTLLGLARLACYRVGTVARLRRGVQFSIDSLVDLKETRVCVSSAFGELRVSDKVEEMHWLINQLDRGFVAMREPGDRKRLLLLAPSITQCGLALSYDSWTTEEGKLPFDERVFEERGVNTVPVWTAANDFLS